MTEAAKNWFIALSRREQILVGIAALLATGVIGFFGIYTPLYGLATDAKRSFYEATMQAGRIEAKAQALSLPADKRPAEAIAALHLLLASEAGNAASRSMPTRRKAMTAPRSRSVRPARPRSSPGSPISNGAAWCPKHW